MQASAQVLNKGYIIMHGKKGLEERIIHMPACTQY